MSGRARRTTTGFAANEVRSGSACTLGIMPIQNVGTLVENLVVTEAALALLRVCNERSPFDFVNSFAMPPSTHWVPNLRNTGFDGATLDRVRAARESALFQGVTYAGLLRANLRSDNGR